MAHEVQQLERPVPALRSAAHADGRVEAWAAANSTRASSFAEKVERSAGEAELGGEMWRKVAMII